jgi:hypothetical protein
VTGELRQQADPPATGGSPLGQEKQGRWGIKG